MTAYHNPATRTTTRGGDLAARAEQYIARPMAASFLQQTVSLLDDFVLGVIRRWLLAYPKSIGKKQVPVAVVFDGPELATVRAAAVDRVMYHLGYDSLKEWFGFLNDLVNLGVPTDEQIRQLSEVKAARDIFVHNRGVANAVYEEKAGRLRRFAAGERMDLPGDYLETSWRLIRQVVSDVGSAAVGKATAM